MSCKLIPIKESLTNDMLKKGAVKKDGTVSDVKKFNELNLRYTSHAESRFDMPMYGNLLFETEMINTSNGKQIKFFMKDVVSEVLDQRRNDYYKRVNAYVEPIDNTLDKLIGNSTPDVLYLDETVNEPYSKEVGQEGLQNKSLQILFSGANITEFSLTEIVENISRGSANISPETSEILNKWKSQLLGANTKVKVVLDEAYMSYKTNEDTIYVGPDLLGEMHPDVVVQNFWIVSAFF